MTTPLFTVDELGLFIGQWEGYDIEPKVMASFLRMSPFSAAEDTIVALLGEEVREPPPRVWTYSATRKNIYDVVWNELDTITALVKVTDRLKKVTKHLRRISRIEARLAAGEFVHKTKKRMIENKDALKHEKLGLMSEVEDAFTTWWLAEVPRRLREHEENRKQEAKWHEEYWEQKERREAAYQREVELGLHNHVPWEWSGDFCPEDAGMRTFDDEDVDW